MQVGIDMGMASGGGPAKLDIEELLATRLLVQGNSGPANRICCGVCWSNAQWVQQVIIDPEGDFVTLATSMGMWSSLASARKRN